MSPQKSSASGGSSKSNAADWDIPCFNCGRYGTFPGQMMTDAFNRTFCSPDCGWSYVLRPSEEARAAKQSAMRAMQAARANHDRQNNHHRRSRSKRSSRHAYMAHQLRAQAHVDQQAVHAKADPNPCSPNKPPRLPSASLHPSSSRSSSSSSSAVPVPKSSKRTETSKRSSKRYVSNAMFEYSMAYQNMSMDT